MTNSPDTWLNLFNLLILTMPGFFLVYGFKNNIQTDFEYFMLSLFWGMVVFAFLNFNQDPTLLNTIQAQPYAASLAFSIYTWIIGFVIGRATRYIWNKIQMSKEKFFKPH